jgi:CubicO group peptidase (beta-lactamase class C family)
LVEPKSPITIHHLLTHTAGISYGWDDIPTTDEAYRKLWEAMSENPDFTLDTWVEMLGEIPLLCQPGTRYKYGMSTDMLGALVQAVSGQRFEQFLQERIFAPLGMVDTAFTVPPEKIGRFAANYGKAESGGIKVIDDPATSDFTKLPCIPSGGGGLVSTTTDYLRFAQMLLNKGALDNVRLLGRKSVELMTTDAMPAGVFLDNDSTTGHGFGLGVSIALDMGKVRHLGSVGTYGWGGAAMTNFCIDPKEEIVSIFMTQFMPFDSYPVITDYRNLLYQALVD